MMDPARSDPRNGALLRILDLVSMLAAREPEQRPGAAPYMGIQSTV